MRKNRKKSLVVLLVIAFIITFIPLIIEAKEVPLEKPGPDEMQVYVFRESALLGAIRHIWVACNETVLASLSSGGYCSFKIKSGPTNIINLVQAKMPVGFHLLKFTPGETVFLAFSYTKGTFSQVSRDAGEKLLMKSKYEPLVTNTNKNDAYEFSLVNPGFFGMELMKPETEKAAPDAENAVITFVRPENFAEKAPFGIWSKNEYLGTLKGHTSLQVKVKPGKHYFIGEAERVSVVEAEVEAGKNYYIQFHSQMGWNLVHIQLIPVKKEINDETLKDWLESCPNVTLDKTSLTDDLKFVMDKTKVVIEEIVKKVEKGEIETRKLLIEDAR